MARRVEGGRPNPGERRLAALASPCRFLIAAYLLGEAPLPPAPVQRAFCPGRGCGWLRLGAALTFVGLAFAIWARFIIAGNWSSLR